MYEKILIATDGSETALQAVSRGFELAQDFGSAVVLVTAARGRHSQPVLDDTRGRFEHTGVPIETVAKSGDPTGVIVDVAKDEDVDLIVVGNKGMSGVRRFFLSSVPNKVMHHTPCGVLIVRTT